MRGTASPPLYNHFGGNLSAPVQDADDFNGTATEPIKSQILT